MDTREIISRTIGFLQKNTPQLQGIYLFGSRAAGEHQDVSDIDIAMLLHPVAAKQMTGMQIFTLQCDMSFEGQYCHADGDHPLSAPASPKVFPL